MLLATATVLLRLTAAQVADRCDPSRGASELDASMALACIRTFVLGGSRAVAEPDVVVAAASDDAIDSPGEKPVAMVEAVRLITCRTGFCNQSNNLYPKPRMILDVSSCEDIADKIVCK